MLYFAEIAVQIALAIHAARTGRMSPWLFIILFLPGIGSLLYVVIELVPEWTGGRSGRRLRSGVVSAVDPGRGYRALAREVEIAPTVHNKMQLGEECLRLGRAQEAVGLFEACAVGLHADDPAIKLAIAKAKLAVGDHAGTVAELEELGRKMPDHRTAEGHLLYARGLEGMGRTDDALAEYRALVEYFPGEEARFRYAELLRTTGATEPARALYRELLHRTDLQGGAYRRMQREWYDAAKRAVA